ncbi:3-deoxy-manno-octulosonate cytidylyltransferase [Pseudobutyrivibrio ruminis]|uniref:3-deoxy-manno-octulosonate cytidylyltransferase n=1 Tax=Pseudobutyrivibrio ruminis TaxID=46206 RepID=UPI00051CA68D|nr:3-deoxy-manno-octulosonate cytidylyltransferase [Pseudobutyrivibrio ruminis]
MKKIVAVIPARYESSRFPGKPLAVITGKTMIHRVYERVKCVECFEQVIVATDDDRIKDEVESFGGIAVMTGECTCGTERVFEAVKNIDADIIINVQGDEPLIKKEMIMDLVNAFSDESVYMATLKKRIELQREIEATNVVKVITDCNDDAIYFSRYTIPFNRENMKTTYYKHIGIYGYTKSFLEKYVSMPESFLERTEKLEQLRVLENGYKIRVKETQYESVGVDLPEHIKIVEEELANE